VGKDCGEGPSDHESRPPEMPKSSKIATEGIWHKRTGLEGNLERAKTNHQSNSIYGTDTLLEQFRRCGVAQRDEVEHRGRLKV
jgi:hypothetical protein